MVSKINDFLTYLKNKDFILSSILYLVYQLSTVILFFIIIFFTKVKVFLLNYNFFDTTYDIIALVLIALFFRIMTKTVIHSIFFDFITFINLIFIKISFGYYRIFVFALIFVQFIMFLFNIYYFYNIIQEDKKESEFFK